MLIQDIKIVIDFENDDFQLGSGLKNQAKSGGEQ